MRTTSATVHRPGTPTTNERGAEVPGAFTDVTVPLYRVAPVRAEEISLGRQTVLVGARAAFPPGTDVQPTDELTAGFPPVRYRVRGVIPVPCARNPNHTKYVRADLERLG
jgi:hypothetical protein